jgi:Protein of unknown function (DUF3237)
VELRPLLTIEIELEPVESLGHTPAGERRLIRFRSGRFDGRDGLRGVLAPGGVDWQTVRDDGAVEIAAHYWLVSDQGESIEVRSEGLRVAPPEVARRLAAGEPVEASEYYFRTHIRLTTSSPRLAWLNNLIGVSTGERRSTEVVIRVHEVT